MPPAARTPKPARGQSRQKHVPQRTCIICRRTLGKRELHRIVRTPAGVLYDPTGKQAGRGAYLCSSITCWRRALDHGALSRSLKSPISPDERIVLSDLAMKLAAEPEPDAVEAQPVENGD